MTTARFGSALVHLRPDEQFVSEAGAMFRASDNVDIDVTTRSRSSGGIMSGIKRMIAGENFFFSRYSVLDDRDAEVGLAPNLQGQVKLIECDGKANWVCAGGSYLGSGIDLNIDTQFQGLRGMLSGESLSFLNVEGEGASPGQRIRDHNGVGSAGRPHHRYRTRGGIRGLAGILGRQGGRKLGILVPDQRGNRAPLQRLWARIRAKPQSR